MKVSRASTESTGCRDVPRCPGHGRDVEDALRRGDQRGETDRVEAWTIVDGG